MFSTAGVVTSARGARTCDYGPMRHRLAFPALVLVLTAWGGACTTFGSNTDPPVGDASVSDAASGTATATVPMPPPGGDSGEPGSDAGADALSPGWGAAFVSAATITGNLGPMQVRADAICTDEGKKLRPTAKFAALLVRTASDTLFTRAESSGPRYLPNGDGSRGPLAIANVASVGGVFDVRVHVDGGEVSSGLRVWTGAPDDGGTIFACNGGEGAWTTENGGLSGATRFPRSGAGVVGYVLSSCNQTEGLFCVEVGNFQ